MEVPDLTQLDEFPLTATIVHLHHVMVYHHFSNIFPMKFEDIWGYLHVSPIFRHAHSTQ